MILHWENVDSFTHKPAACAALFPDRVLDFLPFSYSSSMIRLLHLLLLCWRWKNTACFFFVFFFAVAQKLDRLCALQCSVIDLQTCAPTLDYTAPKVKYSFSTLYFATKTAADWFFFGYVCVRVDHTVVLGKLEIILCLYTAGHTTFSHLNCSSCPVIYTPPDQFNTPCVLYPLALFMLQLTVWKNELSHGHCLRWTFRKQSFVILL